MKTDEFLITQFSKETQKMWRQTVDELHTYLSPHVSPHVPPDVPSHSPPNGIDANNIPSTRKLISFAHSLAAEDLVLTACLSYSSFLPYTNIFTLNTLRLPPESLALIPQLENFFNTTITVFTPNAGEILEYVAQHGENAFYDSLEKRHLCCDIRKSRPLRKALAGSTIWLTGQRREQAVTRKNLPTFEWDSGHQLEKLNPLTAWTEQAIWEVIWKLKLPYNPLHDAGFRSIGCAPCTRAISGTDDVRAGRWWWESPEHKECGLHIVDGRFVRNR